MSGVQIDFNFTAPVKVMLSRVDPKSKPEIPVGTYFFGVITEFASPGTEWRFALVDEKMGYARRGLTYVTTDAPLQHVEVTSVATGEGKFVDKVIVHGVTNPPVTEIPVTGPLTPSTPVTSVTPGVTVPVTPGVNITGTLSGGPISVGSTTPPPGGVPLVGAKDSIFNSESFDKNVIDLEYAIRQQSGLKDKNELRAATFARLIDITKTSNRTREEQAVIDWLAQQVKKMRVEAARLALEEYDKWNSNPQGYHPPEGYDFPAYVIPGRNSPMWLTTTPNPPVLADTSWGSFLAGIISSNGWSPLNNPLLTKGQRNTSLEGIVGFPVFGTVLAYKKLYSSAEGARVLAQTTANLTGQSFTLAPAEGVAITSPFLPSACTSVEP